MDAKIEECVKILGKEVYNEIFMFFKNKLNVIIS